MNQSMLNNRFARYTIVIVLITACLWQCIGAWQDSQTTDEAVHLTSGRSYWQTGSFALNPEHPPLFKLWAAFPLLLLPNATIPTTTDTWKSGNEWTIGAQYLYLSQAAQLYGPQTLVFIGRLPMIMLWLGLAVMIAVWTWRRWGPWPALTSTALFAYDPSFIGHGHLVTNDVATAFVYLGTWFALWWWVQRPSWQRTFTVAFIFALAQLTKFSTALLWITVPFTIAIIQVYKLPGLTWRWWWRLMIALVVVTSLATWAAYGFRVTKISDDPRIGQLWAERQSLVSRHALSSVPPYTQFFVHLTDPATVPGQILERLGQQTVPGYWYWRGFFSAMSHNVYGHAAFLLGQTAERGWWYYFLVALLVKVPLVTLWFVVMAIATFLRRLTRRGQRWDVRWPASYWFFVVPPITYLISGMASHINIGVRHIFPVYVWLPLLAGWWLTQIQRPHIVWAQRIALISTVVIISTTTAAWPNTLGYFNAIGGGTAGGHRILLDSNLDWNQDIWRLQAFLRQHNFKDIHLFLFGSLPYGQVFPGSLPVLSDEQFQAGARPSGIVVVSAGVLYDENGSLFWLRDEQPTWRIGSSIFVYDFR